MAKEFHKRFINFRSQFMQPHFKSNSIQKKEITVVDQSMQNENKLQPVASLFHIWGSRSPI